MLLIDGVKYELWTPLSEDEFERVVKEHTQDIFSEQSIYLSFHGFSCPTLLEFETDSILS